MTIRIAVVTAGLSDPSSTRLLADQLSAASVRALESRGHEVHVDVIELRPLAHNLADFMLTGFASGDLEGALASVTRADAVIAVTPVFTASYSGLFKMFFDAVDKDSLDGTPVLIGATAGTARHSLVLEHALRPLFGYLKAVVIPTGVFAASEDFGSTASGSLKSRVERAAGQLAALVADDHSRSARPVKVTIDNPEDTPDFEDMLASLSR
ncbi:FMN reductase [Nocardioides sp. JQ2195]|uniref:FMN reductase n=1 Tax=Nocardioides sp. JQ2195 TaxID=2592334 RepID=UPI00143E8246|nr:FMN reductase [Nocardioides sp. JQ2195]QIX26751.1 FMN reductase [Nocardioides sp. JQ2195]